MHHFVPLGFYLFAFSNFGLVLLFHCLEISYVVYINLLTKPRTSYSDKLIHLSNGSSTANCFFSKFVSRN